MRLRGIRHEACFGYGTTKLALEGKCDQIDVGRDHLAPVEPVEPATIGSGALAERYGRKRGQPSIVDMVGSALGGGGY